MSLSWPTLSMGAQRENYEQYPLLDVTVRSISLDGSLKTRRAARPILYGYSFSLRHLSAADKELLEQFQISTKIGDELIEWEDERPVDGTAPTILVRLAEPMLFDLDDEGFGYRTEVHFEQEWISSESGA